MAGKPHRKSYHHGDLRRALVEGALAAVARAGPDAVSLRAVARATGVSQAAPYNHFADKEALLAAAAAEGFRQFAAALRAATGQAPPGMARLKALGRAYVGFAAKRPALFRLMFGPPLAAAAPDSELATAARDGYAVLAETLRPGAPASAGRSRSDGPDEAIGAWALVHGLATLLIDRQLRAPPDGAEALFDRVIAAMRFVPPAPSAGA